MHDENSPHVSKRLLDIFREDGTGEEVENLLTGNIDIDELDLGEVYIQWLKMLQMTPEERRLDLAEIDLSPDAFRDVFEEASEKKSLSYPS